MKTQRYTHTLTPWYQKGEIVLGFEHLAHPCYPGDRIPRTVATCPRVDDAAFVVLAVNTHEGMVSLLGEALKYIRRNDEGDTQEFQEMIERAIEKAGGK